MNKLNQEQIISNLSKLVDWNFGNDSISKQFLFKDL